MQILQENVEFRVIDVKFDASTERVIVNLLPLNSPRYLEEISATFHYRHDYPDYRFYRRFLNNNKLTTADVSSLAGKRMFGSIARFTRSDMTQFDGVYSASLTLAPEPVKMPIPVDRLIRMNNAADPGTVSTVGVPATAATPIVVPAQTSASAPINVVASTKKLKSMIDYAIVVLENSPTPLTSQALWSGIRQLGYISKGKTPEATIASNIGVDMKMKGELSIFVKTAPNTFGLRSKHATVATKQVVAPVVAIAPKQAHVHAHTPTREGEVETSILTSIFGAIKDVVSSFRKTG